MSLLNPQGTTAVAQPPVTPPPLNGQKAAGPGASAQVTPSGPPMRAAARSALGVYLVVLPFLLAYLAIALWPTAKPDANGNIADSTIKLFWGLIAFKVSADVQLILLVLVLGPLGGYVHVATSFADFAGNRRLVSSWTWWYLLRPFIAMALALVFYVIVRGGLMAQAAGAADLSPYGIAGVAALVGMFSQQATQKLAQIFDVLFATGEEKLGDKLNSPVPRIINTNPSTIPVGNYDKPYSIAVNGENFASTSIVKVNETDQKTEFVNSTQLTTAIPATLLSSATTVLIAVVNSGGGASETYRLEVTSPRPSLETIDPPSIVVGSSDTNLVVSGDNFVKTSMVRLDGEALNTELSDAKHLKASIPRGQLARARSIQVTVFTPQPGGGVTEPRPLEVVLRPMLTGISPSAIPLGSSSASITLTGENFLAGSKVRFDGAEEKSVRVVSSTQLTAEVPADVLSAAQTVKVAVVSPIPGDGASTPCELQVTNPAPTITGTDPSTPLQPDDHSKPLGISVIGGGFVRDSKVRLDGVEQKTQYDDATHQLRCDLPVAMLTPDRHINVTVLNPQPGGGESQPHEVTVQ